MASGLAKTPSIEELLAQSRRIPEGADTTNRDMQCCCGRAECAYLSHNNAALDDLEKDVLTAAQLGQALLVRHEQYMADAERERAVMTAKIETLESDKEHLEAENARTIEENKTLLRQLEELNNSFSGSELRVRTLEGSLQATQQELRRLEGLAARARNLEDQLAALEEEHAELQKTVAVTVADERSALQRWRKAERGLMELQEQLERIEREAREERERHVEVIGRMERQRTVEKELDNAAGRLKGAAAVQSIGVGKMGSTVVTHFVKDILQDNANLQLGILELREMLDRSNNEVQALREQVLLHSPIMDDESRASTLRAELAPKEPQVISQELHIHHHYHPTKTEDVRRPRKKRISINPGLFTPPNGSQLPSTPRNARTPQQPATAAILNQTSTTVPISNRWSVQSGATVSDFAPSSVPSSPQSMYRNSAIFDRSLDQAFESMPSSPISSVGPLSPTSKTFHRKRDSEYSMRSFVSATNFPPHTIHEEDDDVDDDDGDSESEEPSQIQQPGNLEADTEESMPSLDSDDLSTDELPSPISFNHGLRRSTSHESILSISGIDIHTLKSRPSQLAFGSNIVVPRTRLGVGTPVSSIVSTESVLGTSPVATPVFARRVDSSSYLRSTFAAHASSSPSQPHSQTQPPTNPPAGLSQKVGGWVWSRWGGSPARSVSSTTSSTATPKSTTAGSETVTIQSPLSADQSSPQPVPDLTSRRVVSTPAPSTPSTAAALPLFMRNPGINQKGAIPGLRRPPRAPSQVVAGTVDRDALLEVLNE